MKITQSSCLCTLFLGTAFASFLPMTAVAQTTTSQGASGGSVLGQLSGVFSGGAVIQTIQISGNATWHEGSLEDTGTVSLTASANGSSQMQLALGATGRRTESQAGGGLSSTCQWTGEDSVAHDITPANCWRPVLWFLPALSLQPSLMPSYISALDLGLGTVGTGTEVYRHVQSQLVLSTLPTPPPPQVTLLNQTDIGLDPTSLLPAVLAYSVYPDSGAQTPIATEIHYSDYRTINGIQIPFHIERYLNGSLQLDILVTSAQIN